MDLANRSRGHDLPARHGLRRARGHDRRMFEEAREQHRDRTRATAARTGALVHRDDVAEAYALALEHAKGGERYLLVDESRFTVGELAAAVARVTGAEARSWARESRAARRSASTARRCSTASGVGRAGAARAGLGAAPSSFVAREPKRSHREWLRTAARRSAEPTPARFAARREPRPAPRGAARCWRSRPCSRSRLPAPRLRRDAAGSVRRGRAPRAPRERSPAQRLAAGARRFDRLTVALAVSDAAATRWRRRDRCAARSSLVRDRRCSRGPPHGARVTRAALDPAPRGPTPTRLPPRVAETPRTRRSADRARRAYARPRARWCARSCSRPARAAAHRGARPRAGVAGERRAVGCACSSSWISLGGPHGRRDGSARCAASLALRRAHAVHVRARPTARDGRLRGGAASCSTRRGRRCRGARVSRWRVTQDRAPRARGLLGDSPGLHGRIPVRVRARADARPAARGCAWRSPPCASSPTRCGEPAAARAARPARDLALRARSTTAAPRPRPRAPRLRGVRTPT